MASVCGGAEMFWVLQHKKSEVCARSHSHSLPAGTHLVVFHFLVNMIMEHKSTEFQNWYILLISKVNQMSFAIKTVKHTLFPGTTVFVFEFVQA